MHVIPIGVDTETVRGKPFTFQFYSKTINLEKIIWLKPNDATKTFFAFLDSLPAIRDRHYVLFGHNLGFDLVSLFYDRHKRLGEESIIETWYGWKVEIVYAAVKFAKLTKGHKSIWLIDTFAYFVRSLDAVTEIVCPDLPKLLPPKNLGQKIFSKSDKNFCRYAMRDSEVAYFAGEAILRIHREFDASISVSAPHFASKVFRRHFLKKLIPLPPRKIVYAALSAYHGGKNNITVEKGFFRNVKSLDIRSAYPFAMRCLPSFSQPKLYRTISGKGDPSGDFPNFGIYRINGNAKKCAWPILFDHSFKKLEGEFSGIWVTGFELNEALRSREVKLKETFGYFYDAEADKEPSPFASYVDEFFKRKEIKDQDKILREFWKLLLNSLYGKFIQTRNLATISDLVFDIDENKILEESAVIAGGLFNPFIAALITGHTRAYIHRLEHEYHALHTSTDGIFTQDNPKEKSGLGGLSVEAQGDALILRNKLYIIYRATTSADRDEIRRAKRENRKPRITLSKIYNGKTICKYALHGFHGTVHDLERLWKSGKTEYTYIHANKLKESLRRNLQVNDFVTRPASLNI